MPANVAASLSVAGVRWGRRRPRRSLTVFTTVMPSSPSAPRVVPKPLRPRPPNGRRGSAVGTMRSFTQTDPARTRRAIACAAPGGPNTLAPSA